MASEPKIVVLGATGVARPARVGVPPQQPDKVFNAFFTTKTHRTGVGLRISQSIIES
jgi:C4-dicarboxylate-specific signal transduction histidine kinase